MAPSFKVVGADDRDLIELVTLLDLDLDEAAGGAANRAQYVPHNSLRGIALAIVAYVDGVPAGCAALRPLGEGIAEVKRVYVRPECRRGGVARTMLTELERLASERGYRSLMLETGRALRAANALYQSLGYEIIENYGPYRDMPESVCMEKRIV